MAGQPSGVVVVDSMLGAGLARVASVLGAPRAVMDQVGSHLVASTLRRFEAERAPDGTPWLKSARALAGDGRTLTQSGRLRTSITHTLTDGGHTVEVGTNVAYAAIHQFGSQAGKGLRAAIPARPFLGIDERDRDSILRIVLRALQGAAA